MDTNNVKVVADTNQMSRQAAELFVKFAKQAIAERGVFSVALSGGSTPKKLYELLANESELYRSQIEWQKVHFFFGDERHVPPDHADSNYKMANQAMFARVSELPLENVHRVLSENEAADAATLYEQKLREFFPSETVEFPRFDLVLLGLGADGHTASLFPESEALAEQTRFFIENFVQKFSAYRLTLTFPMINNARNVLFLIGGGEKALVVREILKPESNKVSYPAQLVNPLDGQLLWLLDKAAASEL